MHVEQLTSPLESLGQVRQKAGQAEQLALSNLYSAIQSVMAPVSLQVLAPVPQDVQAPLLMYKPLSALQAVHVATAPFCVPEQVVQSVGHERQEVPSLVESAASTSAT